MLNIPYTMDAPIKCAYGSGGMQLSPKQTQALANATLERRPTTKTHKPPNHHDLLRNSETALASGSFSLSESETIVRYGQNPTYDPDQRETGIHPDRLPAGWEDLSPREILGPNPRRIPTRFLTRWNVGHPLFAPVAGGIESMECQRHFSIQTDGGTRSVANAADWSVWLGACSNGLYTKHVDQVTKHKSSGRFGSDVFGWIFGSVAAGLEQLSMADDKIAQWNNTTMSDGAMAAACLLMATKPFDIIDEEGNPQRLTPCYNAAGAVDVYQRWQDRDTRDGGRWAGNNSLWSALNAYTERDVAHKSPPWNKRTRDASAVNHLHHARRITSGTKTDHAQTIMEEIAQQDAELDVMADGFAQ